VSSTAPRIILIPALQDNYQHLIVCPATNEAAIIDPADAESVLAAVAEQGVKLTKILNTHHHWDHTGGNEVLREHLGIPVICSRYDFERVPAATECVGEGSVVTVGSSLSLRVMEIPGHTLGHIAFVGQGFVFCGDTLFGAGCGRLFEGTPAQMMAALARLTALPQETKAYCGHEYTLNNLLFSSKLEPGNSDLMAKLEAARALRRAKQPTVPTTIAEELSYNPFLRTDRAEIRKSLAQLSYENLTDDLAVFTALRDYKNQY
jgi:hydroxyacylglutathione hydrolase